MKVQEEVTGTMKYSAILSLALIGIIAPSLFGIQPRRPDPPTVRVNGDTIWIVVGDQRYPAALKDLHSPDTTRFGTSPTVSVIGSNDTLLVNLGSEPFEFLILRQTDTIREVFVPGWNPDAAGYSERVELLKRYSRFGSKVPAGLGPFSYRGRSDSLLSLIGREFKVDSIAGSGSDLDQATRLMHWLHRHAPWDGSRDNPPSKTTYDLLVACTRDGKTANCGGMAGMLKSLLLARGLKARQLVCMPYDTTDQDCHSVVAAFSSQLDKWILLDPTHDACFQNAGGEYLSPMEIRRAMVNGDSLALPADINVNGVPDSRMTYLGYMAKNLFRFLSFQEAPSDDSSGDIRWYRVFLIPAEYHPSLLGTVDSTSSSYEDFYTDDSSFFWAPPK